MKYFLYSLIFLSVWACSTSENSVEQPKPQPLVIAPPPIILEQTEVDRVIQALSADDMQGRNTLDKSIEKAANFLSEEFRQIGLQVPTGQKDYWQRFNLLQVSSLPSEVILNGRVINQGAYFFKATQESKNLTLQDVDIQYIKANEDFRKRFTELEEKPAQKFRLVLINPLHERTFASYRSYYSQRSNLTLDTKSSQPVLYVLTEMINPQELTGVLKAKVEKKEAFNVVGILEGKSKKDEYVIFSGHYDHLGIIAPVNGDSIANGANDDASGTTAVVNLARYYKKQNNHERTLIFVAFTAEELGLYGSKYFSEQYDPAKITAMFNIEMIGQVSKWGKNKAYLTGFDKSDLGIIMQKNLQGSPYQLHIDPYPNLQLFYRSDNITLVRKGVPAHTISTYREEDQLYHHVDDEYASLDVANMTEIIKAIAQAARSVVSGADTPSRVTL